MFDSLLFYDIIVSVMGNEMNDQVKKKKNQQSFQHIGCFCVRIIYSNPDFLYRVLVPGTDELLRASSDVWPADVALRAR